LPGPIYSFGDYLKQHFAMKVHKVTVNADFSCPNRDGTKGHGGCIYCNNVSFNPNAERKAPDIAAQIEAGRQVVRKRTGAVKVLAYFQAYSNTYASVERLSFLYEQALRCPGVVGLVIGTRPDCVTGEVLDLLASYQQRGYEVWLEYGLQSAHDETLHRINRGHTFAEYCHTVVATRERGLRVCTHLILGLPDEGREMMLETLARVREVGMDGIKLHPLHVVRHTMLAHEWRKGGIDLLTRPEYVSLVCDMLERMPANWVVHRLTGTASEDLLLAPAWCARKWAVINDIYTEMHRRGSSQGSAIEDSGQIPLAYDPDRRLDLDRVASC
jgi:hypothetical protein